MMKLIAIPTREGMVDDMSQELYDAISDGRSDFLRDHKRFGDDITEAT